VESDGNTTVKNRGSLTDREIRIIRDFIRQNYIDMYMKWSEYSSEGFFGKSDFSSWPE
jgi:hypothetical protein